MKVRQALGGLLLLAAANGLACEIPTVVEIPEAEDAKRQTRAVFSRTEAYVQDMVEYVDCIKAEIETAGGEAGPPLLIGLLVARNNAAVAEVKAVMDLYTERVGPLDDAGLATTLRGVEDIRRSGAAPPVQSRAPR